LGEKKVHEFVDPGMFAWTSK